MTSYPVTCKIEGASVEGFPRWIAQVDVDQAISEDDIFPLASVVDVIGSRGVLYAYKNAGQKRLTLGVRA